MWQHRHAVNFTNDVLLEINNTMLVLPYRKIPERINLTPKCLQCIPFNTNDSHCNSWPHQLHQKTKICCVIRHWNTGIYLENTFHKNLAIFSFYVGVITAWKHLFKCQAVCFTRYHSRSENGTIHMVTSNPMQRIEYVGYKYLTWLHTRERLSM